MSISAEAQPEVFSTELVGAVGDIPFGTRSLKLPDYYAVLDVPRAASQSKICNGYRFAALKWHPDKYPESSRVHAASQFQLAAEAYSVLNDSQSRLVYDRYGHEGLLYGVAGTVLEGSPVKVDAMEVYEAFFGSYSPFADLIREKQESIKIAAESQGPAANRVLDITLREAVAGVTKTIELDQGRELKVTIPPGTVNGSVMRYEGMGLEEPGASRPGPLLVTVRFGPQDGFTLCSEGSGDLHYDEDVCVWDCLLGVNVEIPDLVSGAILRLPIDEVVTATTTRRFLGKGAPRQGGGVGDLVIHFNIKFPEVINDRQRELIMQLKSLD